MSQAANFDEFIDLLLQSGRTKDPEEKIRLLELLCELEPRLTGWPVEMGSRRDAKLGLLGKLAESYEERRQGKPGDNLMKAIAAYETALVVVPREESPQLWALVQDVLGVRYGDYRTQGSKAENLEKAIAAYGAALAVYTREEFSRDWARTQSNLAAAYIERVRGNPTANLDEAVGAIMLALTVFTREAFPEQWALIQNNLGGIYQDYRFRGSQMDNRERAIMAFKAALVIRTRKAFPKQWAATTDSLASVYAVQGRYAEAKRLYKRALAVREKALGPDHSEVGMSLNNLALLYENRGRRRRAERLYLRALAIHEKAEKGMGAHVAGTRANLGGLYKSQRRLAEAEPLLLSALAINEKVFGFEQPFLARILSQLGDLYRLKDRCDQAEPFILRARAIGATVIQEVAVLFATDRKRDASKRTVAFSGERAGALSYGLAIVTVPKEQTAEFVGQRETASDDSTKKRPIVPQSAVNAAQTTQARHLALYCIQELTDKKIAEAAGRRLGVSKTFPGQVFLFVHGYNVSFDNAVRRVAQIAYDMKFDGGTFLFSWPARGRLWDYLDDRETVDIAAVHLKEFLETIVAETKAAKIHFVAHSMGNMVLLRALEEIAGSSSGLRTVIGEIINAAPDVDPGRFAQMVQKIRTAGGNLTLYASRSDKALRFSGWLRRRPRAGFIKDKPLIVPGVNTIDITRAGTGIFALNHDIYSSSPTIVGDMRRIFEHAVRPPDRRTAEFEPVGAYWRLRAPKTPT